MDVQLSRTDAGMVRLAHALDFQVIVTGTPPTVSRELTYLAYILVYV